MKEKHSRIRTSAQVQQRARELRREMTEAEALLWNRLRDRQVDGLKFRRQHPLGPFIADFYCAACRLVVEVDGAVHDVQQEQDAVRTTQLEQRGYRVIRFRNDQVLENPAGVLAEIREACRKRQGG